MTTSQTTILWLGLALIAMNLILHWSDFKKVVFTSPATSSSSGGSGGLFGPILGPILNFGTGGLLSASSPTPTPQPTPTAVMA